MQFLDWYECMAHLDLINVIQDNLKNMVVDAHEFTGHFGVVDNIDEYIKCNMELLDPAVRDELFNNVNPVYTKTQDSSPTKYLDGASIMNSLISSGCEIRGTVENSVLSRGVKIGKGVIVKNSIILHHSVIEDGAVLENVVCDKYITVSAGTRLYYKPDKACVIVKEVAI